MDLLTHAMSRLDQAVIDSWGAVYDLTGGEEGDYTRLCVLPLCLSLGLFWTLNVPLLFFNFFPQYNPLERYKVQKGRHEKWSKVKEMLKLVVFNQILAAAITLSSPNYNEMKRKGMRSDMNDLPTFAELCLKVVACVFLYDAIFFAVHCTMHTKWLYHNIHKVHHSSKVSIGITSAYFHPVDYVLSALSVVLPPQIVSDHVIVYAVWISLHMFETTNAHMGYDVPFLPSAKDHDFHHSHSYYASKKCTFAHPQPRPRPRSLTSTPSCDAACSVITFSNRSIRHDGGILSRLGQTFRHTSTCLGLVERSSEWNCPKERHTGREAEVGLIHAARFLAAINLFHGRKKK